MYNNDLKLQFHEIKKKLHYPLKKPPKAQLTIQEYLISPPLFFCGPVFTLMSLNFVHLFVFSNFLATSVLKRFYFLSVSFVYCYIDHSEVKTFISDEQGNVKLFFVFKQIL